MFLITCGGVGLQTCAAKTKLKLPFIVVAAEVLAYLQLWKFGKMFARKGDNDPPLALVSWRLHAIGLFFVPSAWRR